MSKVLHGTSIDYVERQKRLRLLPPTPPEALNPFNAPTVNAIESMFDRVLALAKEPSAEPSVSSKRAFYSGARLRHGPIRPEERDTIASQTPPNLHSRHGSAAGTTNNQDTSFPRSTWSTLSTTSFPTETEAHAYRYMHPPPDAVPPQIEEKDHQPPVSANVEADDDDDVVELLSSNGEEEDDEVEDIDEEYAEDMDDGEQESQDEYNDDELQEEGTLLQQASHIQHRFTDHHEIESIDEEDQAAVREEEDEDEDEEEGDEDEDEEGEEENIEDDEIIEDEEDIVENDGVQVGGFQEHGYYGSNAQALLPNPMSGYIGFAQDSTSIPTSTSDNVVLLLDSDDEGAKEQDDYELEPSDNNDVDEGDNDQMSEDDSVYGDTRPVESEHMEDELEDDSGVETANDYREPPSVGYSEGLYSSAQSLGLTEMPALYTIGGPVTSEILEELESPELETPEDVERPEEVENSGFENPEAENPEAENPGRVENPGVENPGGAGNPEVVNPEEPENIEDINLEERENSEDLENSEEPDHSEELESRSTVIISEHTTQLHTSVAPSGNGDPQIVEETNEAATIMYTFSQQERIQLQPSNDMAFNLPYEDRENADLEHMDIATITTISSVREASSDDAPSQIEDHHSPNVRITTLLEETEYMSVKQVHTSESRSSDQEQGSTLSDYPDDTTSSLPAESEIVENTLHDTVQDTIIAEAEAIDQDSGLFQDPPPTFSSISKGASSPINPAHISLLDRLRAVAEEENLVMSMDVITPLGPFPRTLGSFRGAPSPFQQVSGPSSSAPNLEMPADSESFFGDDGSPAGLSRTLPRKTRLTRTSTMTETLRDGRAYLEQMRERSTQDDQDSLSDYVRDYVPSPTDSQETELSDIGDFELSSDEDEARSVSESPASSEATTQSQPGPRVWGPNKLLVYEARAFCSGIPGPLRPPTPPATTVAPVGPSPSGPTHSPSRRDLTVDTSNASPSSSKSVSYSRRRVSFGGNGSPLIHNEEPDVVSQSSIGSTGSTPRKVRVVDFVAENIIQSTVVGNHALRPFITPPSPVGKASNAHGTGAHEPQSDSPSKANTSAGFSQSSGSPFSFGQTPVSSDTSSILGSTGVGFGFASSFVSPKRGESPKKNPRSPSKRQQSRSRSRSRATTAETEDSTKEDKEMKDEEPEEDVSEEEEEEEDEDEDEEDEDETSSFIESDDDSTPARSPKKRSGSRGKKAAKTRQLPKRQRKRPRIESTSSSASNQRSSEPPS
ncbi:hypothetical protein BGX31_006675 [Mortierella sp. GBA43]|nr:hypothetical protein BGX31_006675 [Mortierella sp. GBA43]